MHYFHTRNFYLFTLLICLLTSCTYFYTRIDSRVVENIEAYERLVVQLSKVEKEGSRRKFKYDSQLSQFKTTLFSEYKIYEDISRLHQDDLLHFYSFSSSKVILFGTKSHYDGAGTRYAHQLHYKANNELPTFDNKENICFQMIKSERIKENWFYVIMSICDI